MRRILYSFRRCPYAIRARMSLKAAGIECELREVILKDKPASMLEYSPKGTVPVLVLGEQVLDESIDILHWALSHIDGHSDGDSEDQNTNSGLTQEPSHLTAQLIKLSPEQELIARALVARNDDYFKYFLDRYKYADRYPEHAPQNYFESAMIYINELQELLSGRNLSRHQLPNEGTVGLLGQRLSWADIAIFPFVRQFAFVDKNKFDALDIPELQYWLASLLNSSLFLNVMQKYPAWRAGDSITLF